MTMKRLCATVLLLLLSVCAFAVQKSGTIVYINGSKFYIHTVQQPFIWDFCNWE